MVVKWASILASMSKYPCILYYLSLYTLPFILVYPNRSLGRSKVLSYLKGFYALKMQAFFSERHVLSFWPFIFALSEEERR